MNTITLANKRDLPLTTDLLKAMQDAYSQLEALAAVVVPNQVAILTGCTDRGGSVDDGMMIYNGRIVPFKGGARQAMVRLVQTVTTHQVGNGSYEHTTWHAEFGVSPEGRHIPWSVVTGYSWKSLNALSNDLEALTVTNAVQYSAHTHNIDALKERVSATEAKNAEQDNRLDILGTENGSRYAEIQDLSVFTHNGFAGTGQEIANLKTKTNTHAEQINNLLDATAYVPQVLLTGNVSSAGVLQTFRAHPHLPSSFIASATKKQTGGYQIDWGGALSLGTKHDYQVIVNTTGDGFLNVGVRAIYKQPSYFQVTFAGANMLSDTSFDFMIISQLSSYNP